MSRDEFPCAPRKVLFFKRSQILLSHHILFCFSRPVFTQLSKFGLMFPSFLPAAFRSKGKRYKPCVVRSQAELERLMESR